MKDGWKHRLLFVLAGIAMGAAAATIFTAYAGEKVQTEASKRAKGVETATAPARPEPKPPSARAPIPRRELADSRSRALEIEQLQALGYVDGTYDPDNHLADVLVHVEGAAHDGYNFYSSRNARGARLIDMQGRTVHEWKTAHKGGWQHAELLPNGDVIALVKERRLSRYDKSSNLIWSIDGRFHHDLWIQGDELYVLARRAKVFDYIHPDWPTLEDVIEVRTLDGDLKREISVLDAIQDSDYAFLLPSIRHKERTADGSELDVLHTNHVEVFDGSLADRHPIYAKGNLLISMRNINAIAILDGKTAEVLWLWGPTNLTFQHHPTLLRNGHILVFDNGHRKSRVVEVDPISDRIVWEYAPKSRFFSKTRGSNQRLPNGNTLITESDRGYVFEVTPDKRVVWKFANPAVNKKRRDAIWRMTRVDRDTLTFLD